MSLFSVNAVLILNTEDGSRVFAKYYSAPHHTANSSSSTSPFVHDVHSNDNGDCVWGVRISNSSSSTSQSLLRSKSAKGVREGSPREDGQAECRHHTIRQPNRAVQVGKRCYDVRSRKCGRERDHAIQCHSGITGLITSAIQVCYHPSELRPSCRHSIDLWHRQTLDRRTLHENFDLLSLAVDEIVDDGIILETDPTIIVQRVSKAPQQDVTQLKNIDLSEQGMNNLAQLGRAKLGDWLRQGLWGLWRRSIESQHGCMLRGSMHHICALWLRASNKRMMCAYDVHTSRLWANKSRED